MKIIDDTNRDELPLVYQETVKKLGDLELRMLQINREASEIYRELDELKDEIGYGHITEQDRQMLDLARLWVAEVMEKANVRFLSTIQDYFRRKAGGQ